MVYRDLPVSCPACPEQALERRTALRIPRHQCKTCGGAFFARADLMKMAAELDMDLADLIGRGGTPGAGKPCPLCHSAMQNFTIYPAPSARLDRSAVELASCAAHGIWFDDGEIVVALEMLAAGGFVAD